VTDAVATIGVVDTSKADAIRDLAVLLLPHLRAVAKEKGYALASHGSMARDIDLIAVPWRGHDVAPAFELVEAIRAEAERVTGHTTAWFNDERAHPSDYTRRNPEPKPHGRLGWSIHIMGMRCYIDLSVMPTTDARADWTSLWRLFNRAWKHAAEFSLPLGYARSDWEELQRALHSAERGKEPAA
jgi:hypothetical protein